MVGPQGLIAQQTHKEKYQDGDEGFGGAMHRVGTALADNREHEDKFTEILLDQRFLAAGRIQSAMGRARKVTPYNCFVSPTIEDTFVDGDNSIMDVAMKAATTMRSGGGIGYNFGSLRPRGAEIKKLGSRSSGPIQFMHIFDAVCRATSSAGNRRGAQMGVMPVDHPDIEEFIDAKKPDATAGPIMGQIDWHRSMYEDNLKKNRIADADHHKAQLNMWLSTLQGTLKLTGFNVSVGVTDEFMHCLMAQKPFRLRWGGKTYREIDPEMLWEKIMRSTWDWAEPGVLFMDTINEDNNLGYCERIVATNPCAEQPLPPNGACLLGSFNLVKYVVNVAGASAWFDFARLMDDIKHVVRAMDNVVDRATYPLPEQEREAQSKRRMGLGVTGLANALEVMGLPYGTPQFLEMQGQILKTIAHWCYRASIELAVEKGSFPLLNAEKYLQSGFCRRALTDELRSGIREFGIRNSHLLSIAPTGTISLTADNVSSGIEPVFAYSQKRTIIFEGGSQQVDLLDWAFARHGVRGRKADQISAKEHMAVLIEAYKWVDSAVSKTCNVSPDMPWEDFKGLYQMAWQNGCKGATTFNKGGKRAGILVDMDEPTTCTFNPETGRKSCE